jgi:hypothetical protein
MDAKSWDAALTKALATLEKASAANVDIISFADPEYPLFLKGIPDRPPVLYVKGRLPANNRTIACIGTREPSTFGVEVTRRITASLGACRRNSATHYISLCRMKSHHNQLYVGVAFRHFSGKLLGACRRNSEAYYI